MEKVSLTYLKKQEGGYVADENASVNVSINKFTITGEKQEPVLTVHKGVA